MSDPFLGEIRPVSFPYAPKNWALCNGQFLPINQNQALFSLLGTTYGGNGVTTFALPDLRGRVPMHLGPTHTQGERGGEEFHPLTTAELPSHSHQVQVHRGAADSLAPTGNYLADTGAAEPSYAAGDPNVALHPNSVGAAGGSGGAAQPHENRQPFLVLNFCMALAGVFPSRN
ncbi:phage tail protein [Mesoterricola silvestris]|uniref:Tail Collar domain-containing protein n=1 Tax=Mesoterricola silvestris TaxID=2927979 RepID=A0AA48K7K1_9BACT|nr:tail fiber protein [Mesoterricola silvestris]BDU71959.1 tail Collar domain-containing protein [Mesoterricola silvestris]